MRADPHLEPFDFEPRTRVVFGAGAVDALGDLARQAGGRRALLVSDPGVTAAGHAGRALEVLARAGIAVRLFDGVEENPSDRCVERGLEAARGHGADLLVAVGGGSTLDCAKGVGLLQACGGTVADHCGLDRVAPPLPPLIAIPTTAGTGSEVQSAAIITSAATGEKMVIRDRHLAPRAAVLDPTLTLSMPPGVTAATGIDALSHAVESYVCTSATELSRFFARAAFAPFPDAFERVLETPADLASRAVLLRGASFAGLSIEHSMLGAAHSCANPLTHHYGIVHGAAVALLLPAVVRYNGRDAGVEARYAELAALAGIRLGPSGAAEEIARRIEGLRSLAGLPGRLRDAGVDADRLEELAGEAARQWTAAFNPVAVKAEDFLWMYRSAF